MAEDVLITQKGNLAQRIELARATRSLLLQYTKGPAPKYRGCPIVDSGQLVGWSSKDQRDVLKDAWPDFLWKQNP